MAHNVVLAGLVDSCMVSSHILPHCSQQLAVLVRPAFICVSPKLHVRSVIVLHAPGQGEAEWGLMGWDGAASFLIAIILYRLTAGASDWVDPSLRCQWQHWQANTMRESHHTF